MWEKRAREIMRERGELQAVFEGHKLNLSHFDAEEFHKRQKLSDEDRAFYERVTRDLNASHPLTPMSAEETLRLITSEQDEEAFEYVDVLDGTAKSGENDKVPGRLAVFDASADDAESVHGIEDDEDEPETIVKARSWKGFRVPTDMLERLQDHQRDALFLMIERAAEDAGTLLAHGPGLGKTLTALCFLSCLKFYRKTCRSIVVCDKSLLLQWETQVDKFNDVLHLKVFTVDDSAKLNLAHAQWKRSCGGVLLIGTDLFRMQFESKKEAGGSKRAQAKSARSAQPKCNIEIDADTAVVVDEAHKYLQAGGSEFYAVISNLGTRLRILLTGTPMQHSLAKYYNMAKLIAPDLLPATNMEFQAKYAQKIEKGAEATASLDDQHDANLRLHMLIKDLEEAVAYKMAGAVLDDALPSKLEFLILHPLDDAAADPTDWNGSGMDKRELVHAATRDTKAAIFDALLSKFDPADRCIVFSSRIATLKHVMQHTSSLLTHSALLTGEISNIHDRNAMVGEFCETPGSVLFLSMDLGACGLDLSAANRVVLLDVSWNPLVEEQAVARAYRLGQQDHVYVYRLCAAQTAEAKAYELGIKKRRLASTIEADNSVACVYKDADLIVGDAEGDIFDAAEDGENRLLKRHGEDLLAVADHPEEENRMNDLCATMEGDHGKKILWAVHDVNVAVDRADVEWIENQYLNELHRTDAVGRDTRVLDDGGTGTEVDVNTIFLDGELVPPTPIAWLNDNQRDPCVNFYYRSGPWTPEEGAETPTELNEPHAKMSEEGEGDIYGVFAPSKTDCVAHGVEVELYRLRLTDDHLDVAEYDEGDWKRMEMKLSQSDVLGSKSEPAIKMSDIMDENGVYLFADGIWAFKARLVDASGKTGPFSHPSAVLKVEAREGETRSEE